MPVSCAEHHLQEFEEKPLVMSSAPGSLHLLGEHIEFTRGRVLSMATPFRVHLSFSLRTDSTVKIYAANYNERKKFTLSNLKYKKEDRWANLLKGILHSLDNLGCKLTGLNITVFSEIPEAKGLGSSSAIGIAAVIALVKIFDFALTDAQIIYLVNTTETQFLNRMSSLAACFVSFHAHAGALFFLDLRNLEYRHLRLSQSEYSFRLMDSMVPPLGAKEEILDRKNLYEKMKSNVKKMAMGKELRDFSVRDARDLIEEIPEDQRRIGLFIIEEEERLGLAEDCVEGSNIPPLGKILTRSHEGLRDQYEISCPEIDWIAKHAVAVPGVLGCRLTGRGLGGCALILLKGETELAEFKAEYERIFGFQSKLWKMVPSHHAELESL